LNETLNKNYRIWKRHEKLGRLYFQVSEKDLKNPLLAGLFLAVNGHIYWFYAVFLTLLIASFCAYYLGRELLLLFRSSQAKIKPNLSFLPRIGIVFLVALAITVPFIFGNLSRFLRGESVPGVRVKADFPPYDVIVADIYLVLHKDLVRAVAPSQDEGLLCRMRYNIERVF